MFHWINKYMGWRNWAVFRYNSVFENFFILFLIALVDQKRDLVFLKDSLLFILFSIFATTYGYLVNDYSDMELDRQHGKSNTFEKDSKTKAVLVVALIFLLALLTSLPFWDRPYFVGLTLLWFLITSFYSLPPIRLKERGTANIIFVVLAQRLLPVLILFSVFNFWHVPFLITLLSYVFLRGLSSDVNHQLEDYENDLKTGTQTFAVSKGFRRVQNLFFISLQLEKLLLAVVLLQILFSVNFDRFIAKWLCWITAAIYFVGLGWFLVDKRQWRVNPFHAEERSLNQFLHHAYPSVGLPIFLNLILVFYYLPFAILLLFQILIRRLYSVKILTENFAMKFLLQKLRS
ncbi:MAG TPA: hypothetical protein ENL21_03155 [Caldithrix abyssi]|uniref:Prenyltransferase n=1 Tax=Caldithrix abyssi TaxID=187145 RepID=A0A7V5H2R0_CALAY|nr:hypothetical protein [Caldithrix abyssi]